MRNKFWRGFVTAALSSILSLIMALSAFGVIFNDTRGHWSESYVDKWSNAGAVVGYGDGTFKPDNFVTKAEFSSVLNQIFKYTAAVPNTFADVPASAWYAGIIQKVVAAGVTAPDANGNIYPNKYLTRGELFVMIAKAYKIVPVAGDTAFIDNAAINADQKPYVKALQDKGLVVGYQVAGGYEIRAGNNLTRAEMLTVLDKATNGSVTPPTLTPTPVPSADSQAAAQSPRRSGYPAYVPPVEEVTDTIVTVNPGGVGEVHEEKDTVNGISISYTYRVTVTAAIPDIEVTFVIVEFNASDESGNAVDVGPVYAQAGSEKLECTPTDDGNYRVMFGSSGSLSPEDITVMVE
ncbi:MAG: S-layer homology domain-containing protein [Clostridiales bacterium]|jgi:hypothetical protein|nr:S-layer homology domain-containing protein [Clostridiales bacterium]